MGSRSRRPLACLPPAETGPSYTPAYQCKGPDQGGQVAQQPTSNTPMLDKLAPPKTQSQPAKTPMSQAQKDERIKLLTAKRDALKAQLMKSEGMVLHYERQTGRRSHPEPSTAFKVFKFIVDNAPKRSEPYGFDGDGQYPEYFEEKYKDDPAIMEGKLKKARATVYQQQRQVLLIDKEINGLISITDLLQ